MGDSTDPDSGWTGWLRSRLWLIVLFSLPILLVGYLVLDALIPLRPVPLVISRETTLIEGPLRSDGTPDYLAVVRKLVEERRLQGRNAAPLLIRALTIGKARGPSCPEAWPGPGPGIW